MLRKYKLLDWIIQFSGDHVDFSAPGFDSVTAIQLIGQLLTIIRVNGTGALPLYWMRQVIKSANSRPTPHTTPSCTPKEI